MLSYITKQLVDILTQCTK